MAVTIRPLLVLLGVALALVVGGQEYTLSLTVLDHVTELPLEYVAVRLTPAGTAGTTDGRGAITLNAPPGRYTLRVSFTGYRTFEEALDLQQDLVATLRLEPATEQLQTVTVTSRAERELLTRPIMGVERLTAADIGAIPTVLGERDVLKSLQLTAGVSSAGEASNGISVRGGTIDQNLLLLDGAPVFTPTHLFGLFSVFTPDAIGTVDLYRGNIPARFGGRVASVVDVRSRVPSAERSEIRGGIGVVSSHLSVEGPLDRGKKVAGLLAVRGGVHDPIFSLFRRLKNTRSRFADATLSLRYRAGDRDIVSLNGFYSNDFYQLDLLSTSASIPATANQYAYFTLNGGAEWIHLFGDRWSLKSSLSRSRYRSNLRFPQVSGERVDFLSGIGYATLRSELTRTGERHRLSGGVQYDGYRIEPGELDPGAVAGLLPVELPAERGSEASIYGEDEWTITPRLSVNAGLRYVHYRQLGPGTVRRYAPGEIRPGTLLETSEAARGETIATYHSLEPRLGMSLGLSTATNLKASYARTRQFLQNIYNATTPLPTSRWKVSDPNVVPQTADLYAIGLSHRTADERYFLQAEVYYRSIGELLEYRPGADFFLSPNVETDLLRGRGRGYGFELTARRAAASGHLSGEVNYTYSRSENQVRGSSPASRINGGDWYPGYFDQPHAFTARMTIDEGRTHELGFNLVVRSNLPYSAPNGFVTLGSVPVPLFLERNNDRLPVYHRLDFSWTIRNLRRQQRRWTGEWVFTMYNVYGRDNAYNIFFQPKDRNTPQLGIFSKSPFAAYRLSIFGSPILSLTYKFTFLP